MEACRRLILDPWPSAQALPRERPGRLWIAPSARRTSSACATQDAQAPGAVPGLVKLTERKVGGRIEGPIEGPVPLRQGAHKLEGGPYHAGASPTDGCEPEGRVRQRRR